MKFEWVTGGTPSSESVLRALEGLVGDGMIGKEDGRLTEIGKKVAEVPVEIGIARMVSFSEMWFDDTDRWDSCGVAKSSSVERRS